MKYLFSLSNVARYYLFSLLLLMLISFVFYVTDVGYNYFIFFILSYVWHFALAMPDLKRKVLTTYHKLSFLSVIIRFDHYLHVFIPNKGNRILRSFITSISPLCFALMLSIFSNSVSFVFTILGSIVFEVFRLFFLSRIIVGADI
jgi:hypothetical protein